MKNWKPISLLNTVYKLASSCIAERIKSVLPIPISNDQTGLIPGDILAKILVLYMTFCISWKSRTYQEFSSSQILRKLLTLFHGCLLKVFQISFTLVSPLNNGLKYLYQYYVRSCICFLFLRENPLVIAQINQQIRQVYFHYPAGNVLRCNDAPIFKSHHTKMGNNRNC